MLRHFPESPGYLTAQIIQGIDEAMPSKFTIDVLQFLITEWPRKRDARRRDHRAR